MKLDNMCTNSFFFSVLELAKNKLCMLIAFSTGETALGNKIIYPVSMITAFEFTVPVGAPLTITYHSFPLLSQLYNN